MRQELERILGEEIRYLAIETRDTFDLTQREMGEKLHMGESSYSDLETGNAICASALTLSLLLKMQEGPRIFFERLENRFEKVLQPA